MRKILIVLTSLMIAVSMTACSFSDIKYNISIEKEEKAIASMEKECESIEKKISDFLENEEMLKSNYEVTLDTFDYLENEIIKGNVYVTHYESTESGFFFKRNQIISGESGSGIVLKIEDGYAYILTNNHVIATSSEQTSDSIYVYDVKGLKHTAIIVNSLASYDMALLKIKVSDNSTLRTVELAESNPAKNETVYAIGAPFGQKNSIGIGKVIGYQKNTYSSEDSKIEYDIIVHDAYMNHGNSGGMLINSEFKVVGINTLGSSDNDYDHSTNGSSPVLKIIEFLELSGFEWRNHE